MITTTSILITKHKPSEDMCQVCLRSSNLSIHHIFLDMFLLAQGRHEVSKIPRQTVCRVAFLT